MPRLNRWRDLAALLRALVAREIAGRYRGSWLGLGWAVLGPLLMLVLYTTVFTQVMQVRWPVADGAGHGHFALMVYAGMVIHGFVAEVLCNAPTAISRQANYVKRVVFPMPLLPLVTVGAACSTLLIGLGLLTLMKATNGDGLHSALVLMPLCVAPAFLFCIAAAWTLAAVGTFFRDLPHVMGFVATALLFASPVFYPPEAVPDILRAVMRVNPLAWSITPLRSVIQGQWPDMAPLLWQSLLMALACAAALWLYRRVQGSFADVL
jgi:lipopolysaccharide transport system permease protein